MSGGEVFFVDSNVLLYSVDPADAVRRGQAREWLERLWTSGTGRLSWQVLHEFYWNAVRKMGLDAAVAREMVGDFSRWRPVDGSLGLIEQAWGWMDAAQVAYWDALILAAAERSGARYLLSEDFAAGRRYGEIEVVNPFGESAEGFSQKR